MHFKSLLTSVAISALLGYMPVANAADVVKHHPHHVKHTAPIAPVVIVPSAPAFSWAGPYLGVETGVVMTKFRPTNGDEITNQINSLIIKPKEQPAVGLFAGYNFALGHHAIVGIDGNIDYHSVKSSSTIDAYVQHKEDALAGARIRLGLAQGRVLPYIAGGLSAARAGLSVYNIAATPNEVKKQKTYLGWNIGGGLDYAVAHNMLLRLDYRFSQVNIKDLYLIDVASTPQRIDANIKTKSHEIRIGAAYKF